AKASTSRNASAPATEWPTRAPIPRVHTMNDAPPPLDPGESLEWQGAPAEHLQRYPGTDLRYLITDRRVLIVDDTGIDSFTPDALTKLELRPADDGTADVVWDLAEGYQHRRHRPGLTVALRA